MEISKRIFLFIFSFIFLFPFLSANGLEVVGDSSFNINKTLNQDAQVIFTIKNSESFTFYNISFEENDYISMETIEQLNSGQQATITAVISTNSEINEEIRIKGLYNSQIGSSQETYYIETSYNIGVDPCNLEIIKGDTVIWQSLNTMLLKIINSDNQNLISDLQPNETYTSTFNTPQILNYEIRENGWNIEDGSCQIVVLDDSGLITNPNYDSLLTLNINQNYDPTTIETTFIETSYTMDFIDETGGVFTIKNTGSNYAKNIELSGEWFEFSENNFDIAPGSTKGITYTIKPYNYIFETEETNKSYIKNITIEGNFDKQIRNFNIFINYDNVGDGNYSINDDWFASMLVDFCNRNPDATGCASEPVVIYRNSNETNSSFSGDEKLDGIYSLSRNEFEQLGISVNGIKEEINTIKSNQNQTSNEELENKENLQKITDDFNLLLFLNIFVFLISLLAIISICSFLIYKKIKLNKQSEGIVKLFTGKKNE